MSVGQAKSRRLNRGQLCSPSLYPENRRWPAGSDTTLLGPPSSAAWRGEARPRRTRTPISSLNSPLPDPNRIDSQSRKWPPALPSPSPPPAQRLMSQSASLDVDVNEACEAELLFALPRVGVVGVAASTYARLQSEPFCGSVCGSAVSLTELPPPACWRLPPSAPCCRCCSCRSCSSSTLLPREMSGLSRQVSERA